MIASPPHTRKLGLLGVALVKARLPKTVSAALDAVRDEVEAVMISSGFLTGAPFAWVTIAVRYGLKNEEAPHFGRVNRKFGDLPLSIEVDTHQLQHADLSQARTVVRQAVVRALLAAAARYDRPSDAIEALK
ncbi:MAG: immunity protein 39 [Candidatus Didemnitutus sp.]|nr:immunity protein 39 [Candidatus Didemnitutus sp.]